MKLEAKGVSFRYPNSPHPTLEQVDLTLESGERLGLTAPSGRGKSTLCRLLAGYEQPSGGRIRLDNKPLSAFGRYCPVQMIWQHPEQAADPRMRMGAMLAEGDRVEPSVLEGLQIEPAWLGRYPGELSGGELQRFCIARALGQGTRFLLADEISAMLDLITQSQIWDFLIRETSRRGIGMLVISHAPLLLERICTGLRELV